MAQTAKCPTCKGEGRVSAMHGVIEMNGTRLAPDDTTTCPTCHGKGKITIRAVKKQKKDEFGPPFTGNGTEGNPDKS